MITKRVQYRYDSVRNKIGMTDADGGLHTYTYDVMRRLTGVINPQSERTTYAYDLNGRRTSVQLANGTRTSYVYDLGSRVQSVHTLKSDDSTVSKFEYEYDGNGRRTSVLEADGSRVTWTYDRISQVTAEWRTGTNPYRHTFTYDKVGNRTLKIEDGARTTLVYDACNQLLTSEDTGGTTTFTYDGNGNQTVVQKPSGDRTTQVWDYENRLVKTIQPSGGVTSMAYDADGLRLKLEEPTGTKLFVWDDQNYQAETDASGATETAFTTEPSTYGSLISHRKAGATTTYHFDALGSTRALTDESEAVQERYNYTAFGTLLGSPTLLTPFLWGGMVGYYWDAALATQYIRARNYQPAIARWISLDPIGFAGGDANLFRYVGNSPTSGSTGRRVRRVRLARSSFSDMYRNGKGSFLSHDPILYPDGANTYAGWFVPNGMDPSGLWSVWDLPLPSPKMSGLGGLVLAELAWFKAIYPTGWDYVPLDKIPTLRGNLFELSNQLRNCKSHPESSRMATAVAGCMNSIMGQWEEGKIDIGTDADAVGAPADTQTLYYRNGLGAGPDIFLKHTFFDDSKCDRKRVLLKECYRRVFLDDRDDTGTADTRNDVDFRKIECCTKCCGTTVPSERENGPEGCCPKPAVSSCVPKARPSNEA